ncbi:hypothetical protein DEFDS_0283 [Deferribacter desulfuricans SSM1]|uniref:Uncharacterized protein n=1 Tax=Deferribacter desulfuricans (strain DSM 14783 / JCM 11476 / NBRC 101012 / SSM1) TaxID=639282 RepID=D3PB18_DEFDS|nr:hypothetical protein [Deferribacter desulfuricans]BAI79791.1 hypothetical protein DEFDS_0283 [Deferribacter desulfuricans SSM1]
MIVDSCIYFTILEGYFLEKLGTVLTPLKLLSILEKLVRENKNPNLGLGTYETTKNEDDSTKINHEINKQINEIE